MFISGAACYNNRDSRVDDAKNNHNLSAHGPDILPKKVNVLDSELSGFYSSCQNDSLTILSGQFGIKGNGSKVDNTRTCVQIQ